jgi:hypothetical protein
LLCWKSGNVGKHSWELGAVLGWEPFWQGFGFLHWFWIRCLFFVGLNLCVFRVENVNF